VLLIDIPFGKNVYKSCVTISFVFFVLPNCLNPNLIIPLTEQTHQSCDVDPSPDLDYFIAKQHNNLEKRLSKRKRRFNGVSIVYRLFFFYLKIKTVQERVERLKLDPD